ncbi:hypothetical protein Salat_0700600 [Sesamum alatum]|uniref:Uncharacterized protein n=1 Tax=Sesamum alatum TaxID=300844 RepID=A0AAE1YSI2_9LAMI|nr:hypothetical protein Salat_0700600 [Sesamum alatum]
MKRVQATVKCNVCGEEKHNARRCPLKKQQSEANAANAFSQVTKSMDKGKNKIDPPSDCQATMPCSQETPSIPKAASIRPPKPLPFKAPAHKQSWLPAYKPSTPHHPTSTSPFKHPSHKTDNNPLPPTLLQQLVSKVNIRAPPRWSGRQQAYPKQPLDPNSQSVVSSCIFMEKDGKKYVTLSRLHGALSQTKDKSGKIQEERWEECTICLVYFC